MSTLFKKVTSAICVVAVAASTVGSSIVSAASEFYPYAEALATANIISKQTNEAGYRLADNALRQEVIKMALALSKTADASTCAGKFSDVSATKPNSWVCAKVEAALAIGMISANAKFRPEDKITRAEALKLILKANGIATPSVTKSSFNDVTEAWQIDVTEAALAKQFISANLSFRPNENISRGELFKVVAKAAGLEVANDDLGDIFGDLLGSGSTSTGTTSTGTTVPSVVKAGDLAITLNPASAAAANIPSNGTITAGKFDFAAGGSDITLNSVTLKRDGLGNQSDIKNVWFEVNGSRISTKASISSDQTIVTSFLPALVIKAGSTATVDLLVEIASSAGSQHRFGISSATAVDSTASTVKATFPVYTNLLTTTTYTTATVNVTSSPVSGSAKVGDKTVTLGDFGLTLGNENRDVQVVSVTLYNSGTADLAKTVANLAVFNKATGQQVSTKTTNNGRYVTFTMNDTVLYTAGTRSYQVKGDIVSIDRSNDSISLSFDNKPEYLSINEVATGYRAVIAGITNTPTTYNLGTKVIQSGDLSIVRDTSASSSTVAKNTTDVLLLAGTIKVQQGIQLQDITVTFSGTSSSTGTTFASGFTRVKLVIGNTSAVKDAADTVTFQNTYNITQDTPIKVYGDVKFNAVAGNYFANTLNFSSARYSSNDQAVDTGLTTNAFAQSNGLTATVAVPTVNVSNNGAAGTAQTVIGAKDLTLAKISLINNNLSDLTVSSLAFNTGSQTSIPNPLFLTNTTIDLYVDGVAKESRKVESNGNISFASTSFTLAKGATKNIELRVASLTSSYGTGVLQMVYSTGSFSDNVGKQADVSGGANGTRFTINGAGTATFAFDAISNKAKIIAAGTSQELARYTVNATNDDVKLIDLYASATGTVTDISALLSNVVLADKNGAVIANGSVIGNTLKFASINSGNGFLVNKGTTLDLIVKADVQPLTTSTTTNPILGIKLGAALPSDVDASISSNVAANTARFMSVSTSGYLPTTAVTVPSNAAVSNLFANAKPTFAASNGVNKGEHFIDVTVSSANGKLLLTNLATTQDYVGGPYDGILYIGTTGNASDQVATLTAGVFTFTGASATLGNGGAYGVQLAPGTQRLMLKLSGVVGQPANAQLKGTVTFTDASYQDFINSDNAYAQTISNISQFNVGLGASTTSQTLY